MILIPTMVAAFDATRERVAAALDTFDAYMMQTDATPTIDMDKVAIFGAAVKPQTATSAPAPAAQSAGTQNIASRAVPGGNSNSRGNPGACDGFHSGTTETPSLRGYLANLSGGPKL